MRFQLIFGLFLLTIQVNAQQIIEPCKYGQPLINAIQSAYTPNQTLGYGPARDILYSEIDNVGNDLFGIYTNYKVTLDPSQDPSVSAYQNGSGINAEHVYPQSKGAANEPMRSDLHNIYPSKVSVNSSRGSCPFDDIVDANTDFWYFEATTSSSIPTTNIDAYSEKDDNTCEFEPRENKKGDIARAVFYFYAIYQNTANSADPNFFHIQKDKLLEWHYADLPDSIELTRSVEIAQRQGNQNPFALDTSLAKRAFFMADADYPAGNPNCYDILINTKNVTSQDWVNLYYNDSQIELESQVEDGNVLIYNINGQLVLEDILKYKTAIPIAHLPKGMYVIMVRNNHQRAIFKILK